MNIYISIYLSFSFSDRTMPVVKSLSTTSESTTNEALDCLHELSQLLNTSLDKKNINSMC